MDLVLRSARPADAPVMARLVNMAGEGLPLALWTGMAAPGEDPWDVGAARAARDEGAFSWRNALVAERDGAVQGMIITYEVDSEPELPDAETPPVFVPLIALEAKAPRTRYINVLATLPDARRTGVGTALMQAVEGDAPAAGLSLIVASGNAAARRFYAGLGYGEVARMAVVEGMGWQTDHQDWILVTRP